MARMRVLKMSFFENEVLAVLPPHHRLLFQGLWLLADRAGRLEDRPKRIHARVFPYEPKLDLDRMLTELAETSERFIVRYEVDGQRYIQVSHFVDHQRPNTHEPPSVIPDPIFIDARACTDMHVQADACTPVREGKGKEGKGEESVELRLAPRSPSPIDLKDAWNELTTDPLPRCKELSDTRKRIAQVRLRERPLEQWREVIARIQASAFCRGETDSGTWRADFDWLLKPGSALKVLEGKFDDAKARAPAVSRPPSARDILQAAREGRPA